jgi:hypothetical protein
VLRVGVEHDRELKIEEHRDALGMPHKITREQCAATDKDAVLAEAGKEAEAAQAARQAAKGA